MWLIKNDMRSLLTFKISVMTREYPLCGTFQVLKEEGGGELWYLVDLIRSNEQFRGDSHNITTESHS